MCMQNISKGMTTPAMISVIAAGLGVIIIGAVAYQYTTGNKDAMMENKNSKTNDTMMENKNDSMMEDDAIMDDTDKMMGDKDAMIKEDGDSMKKDDDVMMDDKSSMTNTPQGYVTYSAETFNAAKDQKRVLFFHATWCPTCKAADAAFSARGSKIPKNVVVLKTDYDTEKALKAKYGITYQHTFVYVDANGNAIAKWNGGDVDALLKNLQ